ncbi:thiosulfate sulfurtransferase [Synchytrium microbalum]|uniref:Sulfurtransferase n=1 Tax=Synchytrium microbalum TaxID=1806994 RepID=A0A507C5V4_9FUNG|nr:thiosulfate sulfurtransferase [Synchytrium microbalum]TPX32923.1 thiosulfate sulfurtransferase [Synchytrium microbalum]
MSTAPQVSPLVTTQWLASNLKNVTVVDGTWFLNPPGTVPRNGLKEYNEKRIPEARYFDLDLIADHDTKLPHMLPTAEVFAKHVGAMGISETDHVIVYDALGIFSAPRVWWTFKAFGHQSISVLDGGFPKWIKEGHPVETGAPKTFQPKPYNATYQPKMVIDFKTLFQQVSDFSNPDNGVIVDARPAARFAGTVPDPREHLGVVPGHIPTSVNLPFMNLIDSETGTMVSTDKIKQLLKGIRVDFTNPRQIITSCGSGTTAAVINLALEILGRKEQVVLYDGSWTEWGSNKQTPKKSAAN